MKPTIAITAGDINGIGYEVIIKAIADPHICEICNPVIYGNYKVLRQHLMTLGEELHNLSFNIINTPAEAKDGRLNLINCYDDNTPVAIGQPTHEAGQAAFDALKRGTQDLLAGQVQAIVTAPINKDTIHSEQFNFDGHTEWFAHATNGEALMMMASENMKVALVCNHTPITQVANMISEERILRKLNILNKTLKDDFHIRKPRIAVLALNPHAGDNGLIGKEEQTTILPAIQKANEQDLLVYGPYSADGFFGAGQYTHFDAVLAMYHDQGLIPFKTLDMDGVNFTAGLDIIRTSPDHGTGYDIAGTNQANPTSMLHAIYMAIDIYKKRQLTHELNQNPLIIPERKESTERPRGPFFVPKD